MRRIFCFEKTAGNLTLFTESWGIILLTLIILCFALGNPRRGFPTKNSPPDCFSPLLRYCKLERFRTLRSATRGSASWHRELLKKLKQNFSPALPCRHHSPTFREEQKKQLHPIKQGWSWLLHGSTRIATNCRHFDCRNVAKRHSLFRNALRSGNWITDNTVLAPSVRLSEKSAWNSLLHQRFLIFV